MKQANTLTAPPDWVATPIISTTQSKLSKVQSPFAFVSYDELMLMELPKQEWVIENVLPEGLLSAITAESGAGKTWLELVWMRTIASGGMWAGKYPCKAMNCGLLDLEANYGRLRERLQALEVGNGLLSRDARARIHLLSDLGRINILADETRQQVVQAVKARSIQVLFVDTLVRAHQLEENSADMSHVMEALERVSRETNSTVVALHHAGKGSNGKAATSGRGSSAIKAALQHEVMLTRETDKTIRVSLTKAKSAPEIDRLTTMSIVAVERGVSVEFTDEEISIKEPGRPSAKEARRQAAFNLLTEAPLSYSALVDGIMGKAQCSRGSATTTIKELKDESAIELKSDERYDLPD